MISKLFKRFAEGLADNGNIKEKYIELYAKSMEVLLAIIINLIAVLFIGWAMDMERQCILILAAFIPLRSYAGGYHAGGYISCFFESCALLIAALLFIKHIVLEGNMVLEIWLLFLLSVAAIFILAPLADKNKPVSEKEAKVFKKRARIVLTAEGLIVGIFTCFQIDDSYSIMMAVIISAFALILHKLQGFKQSICGQNGDSHKSNIC